METRPPALLRALMNPALYDHPVTGFEIIETHISWVLLTGPVAYKIKKAVDLGFLDFSTLALRRHYCEEELRLNRRLAPQIYRDVVAITGSVDAPAIGGPGEAIEYAVRMREFDPSRQLDRLIAAGGVGDDCMMQLAADLARFHESAARAGPESPWGEPDQVLQPVVENFAQLGALAPAAAEIPRLNRLRAWSLETHRALAPRLAERRRQGYVRECHGDLHLGNIALIDGRAVPFDCLEFSPALRWIDVISEVAFLLMDLDLHGRPDLGLRFLDRYLHHCGDYPGLDCLRYYLVYRAMVRAKIDGIRAHQAGDAGSREPPLERMRRHLALAEAYTGAPHPALIITHGLSGSGKTTLTDALLVPCRALRVRSDVERKRLYGLAPAERSGAAPGGGIYAPAAGLKTYERLAECGAAIAAAGYSAIVDATFLKRAQRERFRALARATRVPFLILDFHAPDDVLRARIRARLAAAGDASEADLDVLDLQLREREPPGADERGHTITIDTGAPFEPAALARRIQERLARAAPPA